MTDKQLEEASSLAVLFHNTYERLAPEYGYETREETKQFNPDTPNGKLMIAVCKYILSLQEDKNRKLERDNKALKSICKQLSEHIDHIKGKENKEPYGYVFENRFFKTLDELSGQTMSEGNVPVPVYLSLKQQP